MAKKVIKNLANSKKISIFSENLKNMEEIWMPVIGYEGLYEVSNLGRVRSLDREARHSSCGGVRILKGKVIKPQMGVGGYLRVCISKDGKGKMFSVHRLVYSAFNGAIPHDMQVNHIDEDKTNNRLENLNLMTPKQNSNWGTHIQRVAKAKSKPVVAIDDTGNVVLEFSSAMDAERQGFDHSNLAACCLGKRRTHRGYRWRYL